MKKYIYLVPGTFLATAWCASLITKDTWKVTQITPDFITEGAACGDVDGDGQRDIIAGPRYYLGPAFTESVAYRAGKPWKIEEYAKDSFLSWADDIDGNGKQDILMVGWPGKEITLYLNPGKKGAEWPAHQVVTAASGESPLWEDINADGKKELIIMQGGCFGYATPDQSDVTKPWVFTAVTEKITDSPYLHGLGVGDLNGDKRCDLVYKDAWYEQPENLPGAWKRHEYAFAGPGGAQMLVHDFDLDGDNDVVTSIHGHGYGLCWYENNNATFTAHEILSTDPEKKDPSGLQVSQLHALAAGDFDKDGRMDFVTGKRFWAHADKDPGSTDPALTVIFYNRKGAEKGLLWEPQVITDNVGVGCDVMATDINQDGKLDVIVGSKKGVHIIAR